MAIKKKDGTIFRLQGPAPVMKNQDLWDDGSTFILHNFDSEEGVILHNFEEEEEKKVVFTPIQDIEAQEIIVPIKNTPVPPKKKKKKEEGVLLIYCMPSQIFQIEDDLYGETRTALSYGSQFTFQGKITVSSDLSIQIWSNVNAEINKGSILYIPDHRRWWKVEDNSPVPEGFILICSPSSLQPSFET